MRYRTIARWMIALMACAIFGAFPRGEAQQQFAESEEGTFYFHGTIGDTLEIEMKLTKTGKEIEGNYVYARHRKAILLKGELTGPYEYRLEEFGESGKAEAQFKLTEMGGLGHPSGTWESSDGKRKLEVTLGEITEKQHQLLQKIWDSKEQIVALSAGDSHTCAMRTVGAACWGMFPLMPSLALSGPRMEARRALPNLLIDETVLAVATSSRRVCLLQSESLRCAQPYDPKFPQMEFTTIPGFERGVSQIGTNLQYACGVVSGALKCWDGTSFSPQSVTTILEAGVERISTGNPQCALLTNGGVTCWSLDYQQQEKRRALVVQEITGLKGEIRSLSAANFDEQHYACAVDAEGLKCWGNNFGLPMGKRAGGVRNLPPGPIAGLETGVTAVASEANHSCAIRGGKVYCWGGWNFLGELGETKPASLGEAVEVGGIEKATQIAVGPGYSCALREDGRVFCWGRNEFWQTGNASRDVCQEPNGKFDAIETLCNRRPVEVRGLE